MVSRFEVARGCPGGPALDLPTSGTGVVRLDWTSDRRNALLDVSSIRAMSSCLLSPMHLDLLDTVTAVFLADIASPRGVLEEWNRHIEIDVPVRDPGFWAGLGDDLSHLLYVLTRDNITFRFCQRDEPEPEAGLATGGAPDVDCVCLLSGGLDSLAGAALLMHTGRSPLLPR